MKKLLSTYFSKSILIGILLSPLSVLASSYCQTNNPNPNFGTMNFEVPADSNPIGMRIGDIGFSQEVRVFDGRNNVNCRLNMSWATPANPVVNGVIYQGSDGKSYDVFETGIPGIGYAIGIADFIDQSDFQPLKAVGETVTFDQGRTTESIGYSVRVAFVATGRLQTGVYPLTNKILANFFARTTTGEVENNAYIQASASFNIVALTCEVTSGNVYNMNLPIVTINDFQGIPIGGAPNNTSGSNTININLNCQSGVQLYATMTDNNDQGSTKNYLVPGVGQGIAEGVGVQMFLNGATTPLSMGPDSSALGNINQWHIQNTGSTPESVSFNLQAKYVRTENTLASGSIRSIATITFSYQ